MRFATFLLVASIHHVAPRPFPQSFGANLRGCSLCCLDEAVRGADLDVALLLVGVDVPLHVVDEVEPATAHGTSVRFHA